MTLEPKKLLKPLIVLAVCAVVWLAWDYYSPSGTWRYKVTVTVETPEGIKTGSAVRVASTYTEQSIIPQQGGRFYNISRGEAVVVDLGKRGVLFSIMSGQDEAEFVFKSFAGKEKTNKISSTLVKYPYVSTLTFTDLNNPKTVKGVEYKNLAKSFGEGVTLKEVTVEITDEPVTTGIEKWLPWLSKTYGYISGKHGSFGNTLYDRLDSGDFQRRKR